MIATVPRSNWDHVGRWQHGPIADFIHTLASPMTPFAAGQTFLHFHKETITHFEDVVFIRGCCGPRETMEDQESPVENATQILAEQTFRLLHQVIDISYRHWWKVKGDEDEPRAPF